MCFKIGEQTFQTLIYIDYLFDKMFSDLACRRRLVWLSVGGRQCSDASRRIAVQCHTIWDVKQRPDQRT